MTFHKEPRDTYANNENLPDIKFYDTEDGLFRPGRFHCQPENLLRNVVLLLRKRF